MKLATLRDQTRDGQLVVVSHDLRSAVLANDASSTLQRALDDWTFAQPRLQALYEALNQGRLRHAFSFDPAQAMAPLPRAFGWMAFDAWADPDAAAATTDASPPLPDPTPWIADQLLGARDARAPVDDEAAGGPIADAETPEGSAGGDVDDRDPVRLGFMAGLAAVTGDVARAADTSACTTAARLWMGFVAWHRAGEPSRSPVDPYGHPRIAALQCTPVAVTTDELGEHWRLGRPHLRLEIAVNGRKIGRLLTGDDLRAGWPGMVSVAARARGLAAGVIVAAGPVRNAQSARGSAHTATGASVTTGTDPLRATDRFRADWIDDDGNSMFGSIEPVASSPDVAATATAPPAGSATARS